MGKKIKSNLIYGMCAQTLTFLVNVCISFLMPRVLGLNQFAYWQLFIFYTSYVCFFHFGLPDGIYLINGGKSIEELDKNRIAGQFRRMIFLQSLIAIVIGMTGYVATIDKARRHVIILTAIYLILINFNNFYGMVYQAVNETRWYSFSLIIDKLFFFICLGVLLVKRETNYEVYITVYCIGRLLACVYSYIKCRELLTAKRAKNQLIWQDMLSNIKVGSNLMLSVIASTLILGVGRAFIDGKWGIKTFGIFSFALTLSNFILQFINQISIVLFPALRNISERDLVQVYKRLRKYIVCVLGLIPMMYLPLSFLIKRWLPQYESSMQYLALLLPISFFDGKMQMLATTYFKVLRKEKVMLKINLSVLFYSFMITGIGAHLLEDIWCVVVGMISAIVFRDLIAEYIIEKELGITLSVKRWLEVLSIIVYWGTMMTLGVWQALTLYGAVYAVIVVINYFEKNVTIREA